MRKILLALFLAFGLAAPSFAAVSVNIGISIPAYPRLVPVPGYPVYYAPAVDANYFFYDGLYWVFDGDNWYDSTWYNGPWTLVDPIAVPGFVLRVPVRYYRHPPAYFRGWRADYAPRWHEHWGSRWVEHRGDWNNWNRRSAPAPAPQPTYQRQYSGSRYPQQVEQQSALHARNYAYQPREAYSRQHYEQRVAPAAQGEAPRAQGEAPRAQREAPHPNREIFRQER